jgi:hypothetical protein
MGKKGEKEKERKREIQREVGQFGDEGYSPLPAQKLSARFHHQMLEIKDAWKRQRDGSNTCTGFIVEAGVLWR